MDKIDFNLLSSMADVSDDPVEYHILKELIKLASQNKRYKAYIKESGAWVHMKSIDDWKPFDFLQYFLNKFREKYRKEYKLEGNVVRAYQRIETFIVKNDISNELYKEFIDIAFSRFFSTSNMPVVGSLCNSTLFNKLVRYDAVKTNSMSWFELEETLKRENEEFAKDIKNNTDYSFLDKQLRKENEDYEVI